MFASSSAFSCDPGSPQAAISVIARRTACASSHGTEGKAAVTRCQHNERQPKRQAAASSGGPWPPNTPQQAIITTQHQNPKNRHNPRNRNPNNQNRRSKQSGDDVRTQLLQAIRAQTAVALKCRLDGLASATHVVREGNLRDRGCELRG